MQARLWFGLPRTGGLQRIIDAEKDKTNVSKTTSIGFGLASLALKTRYKEGVGSVDLLFWVNKSIPVDRMTGRMQTRTFSLACEHTDALVAMATDTGNIWLLQMNAIRFSKEFEDAAKRDVE